MDKILTATQHVLYDTTTGSFPSSWGLNLVYSRSASNNLFTFRATDVQSPGSNTSRGFYFNINGRHHRIIYSFDYRFEPDVEGETAVMNQSGYEGADTFTITMTPEWQTKTGIATRSNYSANYSAFRMYRSGTTFALGTYYIRNLKIESFPWVYCIGGRPLTVTVSQ